MTVPVTQAKEPGHLHRAWPREGEAPEEPDVPTAEAPTNDARDAPRAAASTRGRLTVSATPWATVRVDGRPVGNTPIRQLTLPAGVHQLVLENPPLGARVERRVRVAPGEALRVRADLEASPPRLTLR